MPPWTKDLHPMALFSLVSAQYFLRVGQTSLQQCPDGLAIDLTLLGRYMI